MKNKNHIAKQRIVKLVFVLAVSLLACAGGAFTERVFAQEALAVFTYSMGLPTADLKEYADEFSYRGFSFDYRFFLRDQLSVGFGLGWQNFSELESGTFSQGTITATGTQIRYATGYPFMGTGYFYLGDPGGFRPYAGLQGGLYYVVKRFDFGAYSFYEDFFQFGLIPEAGVLVPLSRINLIANVKYHYAFATADANAFSHFSFNIGIAPGSF
jgi:hypothetical protein